MFTSNQTPAFYKTEKKKVWWKKAESNQTKMYTNNKYNERSNKGLRWKFILSGARKPLSAPRSAIRRVLPVAYAPERALHSRQHPLPPPHLHTRQSAHFNWEGLDITGNIRNPFIFKYSWFFLFFGGTALLRQKCFFCKSIGYTFVLSIWLVVYYIKGQASLLGAVLWKPNEECFPLRDLASVAAKMY